MSHFDIGAWTDFARGCAAAADRAAMQAHLSAGCGRCQTTLNLLQRIVVTVRGDGLQEPPPDVVRCARAISALQRPRTSGAWNVARLVYDSLREPLPAGIRADTRASRHAVFEAGDLFIDLRVEREHDQSLMRLVGQLTHRADPNRVLTASPVLLMGRRDVVAHAVSNRFGEFQMDYPPARDLRLCIALAPTDQRIEVSLNQLAGEQAGRKRVRGSRPTGA
jgi:hypothetical protein